MLRHSLAAALAVVALTGCGGPAATHRPPAQAAPPPPDSSDAHALPDEHRTDVSGTIVFAADAGAGPGLTDAVDFGRVETHPMPMDLYLVLDGRPARRIVATRAHERCPALSPDGARLAHLAGRRVVVRPMDANGDLGAPDLVARLAQPPSRPRMALGSPCPLWSPDARHLAFRSGDGWTQRVELHVLDMDGDDRVLASLPAGARANRLPMAFTWSPDAEAIAFTTAAGVRVVRLDGSPPELVWRADADRSGAGYGDTGPIAVAWSSGDELALTVKTGHTVGVGWADDFTVHVVDLRTGRRQRLGEIHEYDSGAAWSPDASRLAYVGPNGRIRVHDRATGTTTTLAPRRLGDVRRFRFWDVAWSPDGERLLALARAETTQSSWGAGFSLVAVDPQTSAGTVVTPWTFAMDWINMTEVTWGP
ncbi:PD40 domain-containing protein [Nocardioides kongjuensis]|uniref:Dipeptidyl aminopeptidase/acylaminoacyl peptidase/predicted small lipoprotein YifL n=1 Tax=Nocardioides kongjuensis TaxID=349522 RepID=A0A852RIN0_9ACTN|nr:PD40 domain-containing protein [Nocardioides kongjuensis]NYD33361.1 dipeptidyl aminopeptidase/acylaminoacyl peptidase/predicted small lipoprotein YifL [Nocardioides kongjuensis]